MDDKEEDTDELDTWADDGCYNDDDKDNLTPDQKLAKRTHDNLRGVFG